MCHWRTHLNSSLMWEGTSETVPALLWSLIKSTEMLHHLSTILPLWMINSTRLSVFSLRVLWWPCSLKQPLSFIISQMAQLLMNLLLLAASLTVKMSFTQGSQASRIERETHTFHSIHMLTHRTFWEVIKLTLISNLWMDYAEGRLPIRK